ncbi:MAG: hypothetical protein GY863_21770 [bacterium]|nr:hypothetical protein [bacterium]
MKITKIILLLPGFILLSSSFASAAEIHDAARAGDLEKVTSLLSGDSGLLEEKDSKGFTPLHIAITKDRREVVRYLIEKGADLNSKNNNGLRPLQTALDRGKNAIADLLIEKGADINIRGFRNQSLLHQASRSGNNRLVNSLLNKGADINAKDSSGNTSLDLAVISGKASTARLLVDKGGEVGSLLSDEAECQDILDRTIINNESILTELIMEFLQDRDFVNEGGHSIIHRAAAFGNKDMVSSLLDNGIDINKRSGDGKTPLYYAAKYGNKELADFLKGKGAQIPQDLEENYGYSPYLNKELSRGEAEIWYLGHSGWAIKTKNHLLIFDYFEFGGKPLTPIISNGFIDPQEIKDQNVTVLVTHSHDDHFDRRIFNWKNSISNINYVLGFRPRGGQIPAYTYTGPGETKNVNGIEISAIKSTDSGVGFLIKVDGLTIYHGGDHSNQSLTLDGPFTKEIDYLASQGQNIDLAFILIGAGCGGGYRDEVLLGNYYILEKFTPKAVLPMHSRGNEFNYKKFAEDAKAKGIQSGFFCAEFGGDRFFYSKSIER